MKVVLGPILIETVLLVSVTQQLAPTVAPTSSFDYVSVLLYFLAVPLYAAIAGWGFGRKAKKSIVWYSRPQWEFQTIELTTEECGTLSRDYAKQYRAMVPVSKFWYFYLPVVLIVICMSLPYYSFFLNRTVTPLIPIVWVLTVSSIHVISFYGAFGATSNSASRDFRLPLIREALWLARLQRAVANVSSVRIAMDKGRSGDFTVYSSPRVIVHISGYENEANIESASEELGSLSRVLCVLWGPDNSWGISWLWDSRDRNFMKRTPDDKEGYYVRNPVPSRVRELGVKDVRLVTENAIALVLSEYSRRGVSSSLAAEKLSLLGVK
jgi:hypothetical protein